MYNGVPLLGTYQKDVVTRMARWVVGVEITRCAFFHMQITYMKVYVCSFEARRSDVFIGKLSQCAHTQFVRTAYTDESCLSSTYIDRYTYIYCAHIAKFSRNIFFPTCGTMIFYANFGGNVRSVGILHWLFCRTRACLRTDKTIICLHE